VVVNNTFLDVVPEDQDRPVLAHVWSAPGKLVGCSAAFEEFSSGGCRVRDPASAWNTPFPTSASTTTQSPGAELEMNVAGGSSEPLCVAQSQTLDSQDGVDGEDPMKMSKTSKRNQRRRAQANSVKEAKLERSPAGAKAEGMRADALLQKETAISTESNFAASSHPGDRQSKAKGSMPESGHELDESRSTDLAMEAQSSSASSSWEGANLTRACRLRLKNKFMDMVRQEFNLSEKPAQSESSQLMTPEELSKFDCKSKRPLVSVHGDIFDVSGSLSKYGPGGERCFQAGTDITWAVVSGCHTKDNCNCFYDIFKAKDDQVLAGRFMNLCSAIVAFQRDYGKPVGRLSIFTNEASLPPPPTPPMEDVCPVQ